MQQVKLKFAKAEKMQNKKITKNVNNKTTSFSKSKKMQKQIKKKREQKKNENFQKN